MASSTHPHRSIKRRWHLLWLLLLPYDGFQSELSETLARYMPPWVAIVLLMHIDILLTPASSA